MTNTISWTSTDLLEASQGDLLGGNASQSFTGISIDSRNITTNEVFVAIKGDVHDGHRFAEDVIRQGVKGIVINKDTARQLPCHQWEKEGIFCIAVNDTTKTLGDLACFHRKRTGVKVVAITGSNGKTTTREMTASVVAKRFNTLSSSKNFNNAIGLPLTLFKLNSHHQWAVVELGMNAPGEIDRLAEICLPNIGVITNIGPAHLEGVGSIEGVMNAKGELLGRIKPDGIAVLNADDPRVVKLAEKTSINVIFFGNSKTARIRAQRVKANDLENVFTLVMPEERISVKLGIPGVFMVSNALAAAAVGYQLGLSAQEIKTGLESFKPAGGRMQIIQTSSGVHIIDDTYNANPGSVEAAVKTLMAVKKNSRGVLVIGDMFELGKHAESMHKKIGALSARSGIERLYATGPFAETVAAGARDKDMDPHNIFTGSKEQILDALTRWLKPNDWVLVKGSRAMGMEEIVQGLKQWADTNET
jgi:UDP-N-acetylmuramoyl-tripeptide--D-alanyl-D-alanine ligase